MAVMGTDLLELVSVDLGLSPSTVRDRPAVRRVDEEGTMSPATGPEQTPAPEVHLCRCGQPMIIRDAMTLGYREDPPVYVCPKRATERGHETWAVDMASRRSSVA